MANPSWRVKSRPCPFYSQGRCLFSDSCNFVHEAKVKAKLDPIFQHHRKRTSQQIQTSQSDSGHGNHRRALSDPTDSPITTPLALQDRDQNLLDRQSVDSNYTPIYSANRSLDLKYPDTNTAHTEFVPDDKSKPPPKRKASVDDSKPVAKRSSTPSSLGLLSPVFSPPLVTFSKQQPIEPNYRDEDWVGPAPFMISPPQSPSHLSTLDIVTSPFRSPTARLSQFMPFSTMKRLSVSEGSQTGHVVHTAERRHISGLLLQLGSPTSSRNSIVFDDSASILTEGLDISESPEGSPQDRTERLAYLDATQPFDDGDALHTLYQAYSERSPTAEPVSPSVQDSHRPPVFSLPVTRKASPIVPSSSLPSASSAPPSAAPNGEQNTPQRASSDPISDKATKRESTKVPFGFRTGPNPARSSLWLKRQSKAQQSGHTAPSHVLSPPSPSSDSPVSGGSKLRPLRLSIIVNSRSQTPASTYDLSNDTADQTSQPSLATTASIPIPSSSSHSPPKISHRHSLEIQGTITHAQDTLVQETVPLSAPLSHTSSWRPSAQSATATSFENRRLASESLFEEPEELEDKTSTPHGPERYDIQDQPISIPLRNSSDISSIPPSSPWHFHTPPNRTPVFHSDILPASTTQDLLIPTSKDDETISNASDEYHTALDSAPTPQIAGITNYDDHELEVATPAQKGQLSLEQGGFLENSFSSPVAPLQATTGNSHGDEGIPFPVMSEAAEIPNTVDEAQSEAAESTSPTLDVPDMPGSPTVVFSPPKPLPSKRFSAIPAIIPVDIPRRRSQATSRAERPKIASTSNIRHATRLGNQALPTPLPTPPQSAIELTSIAQEAVDSSQPKPPSVASSTLQEQADDSSTTLPPSTPPLPLHEEQAVVPGITSPPAPSTSSPSQEQAVTAGAASPPIASASLPASSPSHEQTSTALTPPPTAPLAPSQSQDQTNMASVPPALLKSPQMQESPLSSPTAQSPPFQPQEQIQMSNAAPLSQTEGQTEASRVASPYSVSLVSSQLQEQDTMPVAIPSFSSHEQAEALGETTAPSPPLQWVQGIKATTSPSTPTQPQDQNETPPPIISMGSSIEQEEAEARRVESFPRLQEQAEVLSPVLISTQPQEPVRASRTIPQPEELEVVQSSVTPPPSQSQTLIRAPEVDRQPQPDQQSKTTNMTSLAETTNGASRTPSPVTVHDAAPSRPTSQVAQPCSSSSAVTVSPAAVAPPPPTPFRQPTVPPMPQVETPKPLLAFAIASDDVAEVEKVLKSGEAHADDQVGPQSALDFVLTNDQLDNKLEMVKTLLAFGAKPSKDSSSTDRLELDPATRYHLGRAEAEHTKRASKLIQKSFFKPLTRVRYNIIGQDMALEQLFRVLNMHSKQLTVSPIVVFLCGPSGYGKSYLAQKFGSFVDISTHIVNMTAIRSTQALWNAYSLGDGHDVSPLTLGEFLTANQGKRCVVVLEEIEKTEDEKSLWSLLMPWESGRCLLEPGGRPIDVRNVIWICTSNLGAQMIFELDQTRPNPSKAVTRDEYMGFTTQLRTLVSDNLGPSLLSRVTAVLPFVPFSVDERMAIAAEAFFTLGGEVVKEKSPAEFEEMVLSVLESYVPTEGARSLYRSVSSYLLDNI